MAEYCRTIFGDMLLTEPLEKIPVSKEKDAELLYGRKASGLQVFVLLSSWCSALPLGERNLMKA